MKTEDLAQPEQEPMAWRLVPVEPTEEMLKAMDECSTEGYDERLYAGHAASVYMAAVDVAPIPPQPKEPEQEPDKYLMDIECTKCGAKQSGVLTVNTTPPQRTWVGLTDEQIDFLMPYCNSEFDLAEFREFARAIEAAHGIKEKNT